MLSFSFSSNKSCSLLSSQWTPPDKWDLWAIWIQLKLISKLHFCSKPSSRAGVTCPATTVSQGSRDCSISLSSTQPLKRAASRAARPTSPTSSTGEDPSDRATKRARMSVPALKQENTGN
ncbi:unnamed protein product [Oikopleura dioica]|uniref:Uncharacterized protein n=1 Tax=Oikopleura dioica TaxID=34765 RepID=E4XU10_OIKDI|nr:unnamed protein product [Oikopleura dioica]